MKYKIIILFSILIILILISTSIFYWYELRPRGITRLCNSEAKERAHDVSGATAQIKVYEAIYKSCTRERGL